jgi:taurine dioxygenase
MQTNPVHKLASLGGGEIETTLKELAEQVPQIYKNPNALHCARQDDADWKAATAVDREVEEVLAVLRPQLEHLSPTIGSVVHGVDLSRPMSDATVGALRRLLLERKAIFFRDQDLTSEQHIAFTRLFGELEVHPFTASKPGYPELLKIEHGTKSVGSENIFHSDVTWRENPSLGSVLYAQEVPQTGGDTLFVDMYAAYYAIPENIRAKVEGRSAQHDWHHFRHKQMLAGVPIAQINAQQELFPAQLHPIIRTHPETGRKILFVNPAFTTKIEDATMPEKEQNATLLRLYDLAKVPEFACRFQWQKGSVAFWDNRCTQHYATSDYFPDRREMERCTIVGDKPFFDEFQHISSML